MGVALIGSDIDPLPGPVSSSPRPPLDEDDPRRTDRSLPKQTVCIITEYLDQVGIYIF
jgi:hypothetical protein